MRSSAIVLAALSALALAAPLQKRAYVTDVVIDFVTVTVTEGDLPTSTSKPIPTTTSTPPVVIPTTTPEPVVTPSPAVFNEVQADAVTPTPAPIVTPTPEPVPTPQAAPVVVAAAPVFEDVQEQPTQAPAPTPTPAPAPAPSPSPEPAPAPAPVPVSNDYKSTVLYHHNVHRANHSAPALTYDDTLAGYAAEVASKCVFAHDKTPGGGNYGQNLAQIGSTNKNAWNGPNVPVSLHISNQWYNGELGDFTGYGQENPDMSNFGSWGHFSQVVWKGTSRVGCATQFCDSTRGTMFQSGYSGYFTVCNYGDAGNMGGAYAQNIARPLGKASVVPS